MSINQTITHENAKCTLWLTDTPQFESYRTATIGDFSCENVAQGVALLEKAFHILKKEGIEYAIGPMNQNTWHSYRLVTKSDGSPPFFLELSNPEHYVEVFQKTGFQEISKYFSTIDHKLDSEISADYQAELDAA